MIATGVLFLGSSRDFILPRDHKGAMYCVLWKAICILGHLEDGDTASVVPIQERNNEPNYFN